MPAIDDYTDTQAGAYALSFHTALSGRLDTPLDKDVFKVHVTKGRTYFFAFAPEKAEGDPVLKGWSDGHADTPVDYPHFASYRTYTADYTGDYFLQVANASKPGTADYKLVATEIYPDDYSASRDTTGVLPVGGKIAGEIEINGDRDWFKVYLQQGVQYAFTLAGKNNSEGTLSLGWGATVFLEEAPPSGAGAKLQTTDTTFTHYTLTAQASGYHYLSVYVDVAYFVAPPPTADTGTYALHATVVANGTGTGGNDILAGLGTGTVIAGGAGLDTAVYGGARAGYSVTQSGTATSVANVKASGADSVTGVERLLFDDGAVALDVAGAGGQAYRLYQAAFNRAPDKAGIGYWIAQLDKGTTVYEVAHSFIGSGEFQTLYGAAPTDNAFIDALYQNVLHRAGDQAGIDYWNGVLASGVPRAAVLASFSESPENQAAILKVIGNGFDFTPYG